MRARTLAAAADGLNAASGARTPFCLSFLTDPRGPDPECVARVLPPGAALILRHYRHPRRAGLARRLRTLTAARGALFLVAGDAALAADAGADGVHWRADQLRLAARPAGARIVTAACHSGEELAAAAQCGADAAFLSPVFATMSHPDADCLGPERFLALAAAAPLPVFALGGIDVARARRLSGPNVAGFGAIGAFAGGAGM